VTTCSEIEAAKASPLTALFIDAEKPPERRFVSTEAVEQADQDHFAVAELW